MCGIIGIYNHKRAAELATLGLFAEQHRGQESCGMAVSDGRVFRLRKKMGLVKNVFRPDKLAHMQGSIALGHVRYPTRGSSSPFNAQPHVQETLAGPSVALASNGDLVNYDEVRARLECKGIYFSSQNDGELLLKYIVCKVELEGMAIPDAIRSLMHEIKGAYSTVLATRDRMYMFRDPYAIRPMVYGHHEDGTVAVASENCALDILGIHRHLEVPPAGILWVDDQGMHNQPNDPAQYRAVPGCHHCVFEHIYFSRPDSFIFGENVYSVRERIGAKLADSDKGLHPDVVVPVPDSSNFIALGYAKRKGIPFEMGLIRNHYVGRTFIKPQQTVRDESVSQKFNPLPNFFKGKKVVLVDDSIVRGTTIRKIVQLLLRESAAEVHLRIGSPPVMFSCYYGIDTPTRKELIASGNTIEEIREYLGATSLRYVSADELCGCVGEPNEYCYACFTGHYPIEPKETS
ncbi:MAG: amidophosphoribosyltransferase [Candidatus Cloacimonetes bacterium]|nr:amidophosphoribosyltransferase [Candidatus Cloacimonadota bacterium]